MWLQVSEIPCHKILHDHSSAANRSACPLTLYVLCRALLQSATQAAVAGREADCHTKRTANDIAHHNRQQVGIEEAAP